MKSSVPRVVMLGGTAVGKTSLINRIVKQTFDAITPPTTGAGFYEYKGGLREIQIWDTAGMERFRSLNSVYYHRAVGAILVFDLTNVDSFKQLESWRQEFVSKTASNAALILVGNKCDKESDIEVEDNEIDAYCQEHTLKYYKVSALNGTNVIEAVNDLIMMLPPNEDNVESTPLEANKKGGCC